MTKNIIHFETKEAAALFKYEILGQLSDGAWENTRPYNHWQFWNDSEIVVDGKIGYESKSSYPMLKNNYNIANLKEYVGYRMQAIVLASKLNKDVKLTEYLVDFLFTLKTSSDDYWKEKAKKVKAEFGEDLDKAYEEIKSQMNEKDLNKAIKEIKLMFKTKLN